MTVAHVLGPKSVTRSTKLWLGTIPEREAVHAQCQGLGTVPLLLFSEPEKVYTTFPTGFGLENEA